MLSQPRPNAFGMQMKFGGNFTSSSVAIPEFD